MYMKVWKQNQNSTFFGVTRQNLNVILYGQILHCRQPSLDLQAKYAETIDGKQSL